MNCDNCQELISEYIDGELGSRVASNLEAHLAVCRDCALIHEDFAGMLSICSEEATQEIPPPNSQALWCRINNIIETEVKPELFKEQQEEIAKKNQPSWFGRIRWQISLGQVFASVFAIALVSSLLTFVAIRNIPQNDGVAFTGTASNMSMQPSLFDKVLSKVGLAETAEQARERKIKEQKAAIDYWNQRIEARRAQWDKTLRAAFERNLQEIDQVVTEHTRTLEENPQDELTGEMLDSALDEKMKLLREFAEL